MTRPVVSDEEIELVAPILKRLKWANSATRRKIQAHGVNILPVHYYSNAPSIEDIENSFEYAPGEPPYAHPHLFDSQRFVTTLQKLLPYAEEFRPAREGDEETCKDYFWNNRWFSNSDAMAYFCFVRHAKPANILEIGSGFSTLVALQAIKHNGLGRIHCIEPFPRTFLIDLGVREEVILHAVKAQSLASEFLNDALRDGDILFIDSTHTVKTGSDCLHLYLRLLPTIRRDILVHIHDIYLPWGLPQGWLLDDQVFWTEQYLLLAFLIDNPFASLLYASHFNATYQAKLMTQMMAGKSDIGGGSVWFEYRGSQRPPLYPARTE